MTVIATIITRYCIAVSSDSLTTDLETGQAVDWERAKVVGIRPLRAAVAYWGLASFDTWTAQGWLESNSTAAHGFATLEEFATDLHSSLDAQLLTFKFKEPKHAGIGIHLMGYERVNDYQIPELFLISNYSDPSYSNLCCLHLRRETYHIAFGEEPTALHREPAYRLKVHEYLANGGRLIFNNGDPSMYNPAARSFFDLMKKARERGVVKDAESVETIRALAKRPIKIVSDAQHDFYRENKRKVGGKIHDLVITPSGEFSSTSGDEPAG